MPAPDPKRRLRLLSGIAALCTLLVLALTTLSAALRLDKAGLGCADWPACYGAALRATPSGIAAPVRSDGAAIVGARIAHRFAAVAALALIVAMLVVALGGTPPLRAEAAIAAGLLVLALALAVLGRFSAEARVPAVTLGNLLGGLAMLASSTRLAVAARRNGTGAASRDDPSGTGRRDGPLAMRRAARWLLVLVFVQAALGALASASYSGLSCATLVDCWRGAAAIDASTLDPWREPVVAPAGGAAEPGALIQLLHRAGAGLVAVGAIAFAVVAWRRGRKSTAAALAGLVALEAGLGAAMVSRDLPMALALMHNVGAALLVVLLARSA